MGHNIPHMNLPTDMLPRQEERNPIPVALERDVREAASRPSWFADLCAAECAAGKWFETYTPQVRRTPMPQQIADFLAVHGPSTAQEIATGTGHSVSGIRPELGRLYAAGSLRLVSRQGRYYSRLYALVEVDNEPV